MPRAASVLETGNDPLEARNRLILKAARALMDEGGLEGLTIRAVLQKTGLARRAFYECFAEKDDLVLAVFGQSIGAAVEAYNHAMTKMSDPLERLKLIVVTIVHERGPDDAPRRKPSKRGAALSREHLRLAEARPAELQQALSPLIALIARQLAEGMDAGAVRRAEPQRLAWLIYNLVSTTVHAELLAQERAGADRARRAELAEDIWEFCRRAIAV